MLRVQLKHLHSWRSLFRTTRGATGILIVTGLGLILPDQTADELVALSDMWVGPVPGLLVLQFALGFLALSGWYWARAALAARFGLDDTLESRRAIRGCSRTAFDTVPRLVFLGGVLLGVFLLLRGPTWRHAVWLAAWAVPSYALIRWRLALTTPDSRSHRVHFHVLKSRRHFRQWLRVIVPRIHALLLLAPFGPPVAAPLMGAGALTFLYGAIEGFVPWGSSYPGLPALASAIFPGPSVALIGVALLIGPLTALVFAMDGLRIEAVILGRMTGLSRPPVLTALVVWSLVAPLLFSLHTVRVVSRDMPSWAPEDRAGLDAWFADWAGDCAPGPGPVRPIIVSVSGGASRAGIWAAHVLAAVQQATIGARNTGVFAVSSVSGGSLGAAAYMAVMAAPGPRCGPAADAASRDRIAWLEALANVHLGGDALGPLLAGALLSDAPRALLSPVAAVARELTGLRPRGGDRAEALERAFERLWHEDIAVSGVKGRGIAEFSGSFLSLFQDQPGSARPGMPIWLVNGTDMTTGGRMLTEPFVSASAPWPFRASSDVIGLLGADVPISTAINNSARFPYAEPSGELASVEGRRTQMRQGRPELLDGGYFDNEGLQTTMELAEWLKRQRPGGRDVQPIIVQATSSGDVDMAVRQTVVRCPDEPVDIPTDLPASPGTLQVLAPIMGLYNVRGAHAAVLLREVRDAYCGYGADRAFFHFYLFRSPDSDIPLNWLLSPAIVRAIRAQLQFDKPATVEDGGNGDEFRALRATLHGEERAASAQ